MTQQSPLSATKTHRLLSAAASDNPTTVAARESTVRRIAGFNNKAAAVFLKLYDKATAPSAADTPRKTYRLPATANFDIECDDYYSQGISYRLTAASADADNTALVAGDIQNMNIDYRP